MPWKETDIMELRIRFIQDWLTRTHSVVDLCALYGISRNTVQITGIGCGECT
jgi:hypothetical protein